MFKFSCILFFLLGSSCKVNGYIYLGKLYDNHYNQKKEIINFELIEKRCIEYFKKVNRPNIWKFGSFYVTDTSFVVGIRATCNANIDEQIIIDNFHYKVISHQICTYGCYPNNSKIEPSPYNKNNYNKIKSGYKSSAGISEE